MEDLRSSKELKIKILWKQCYTPSNSQVSHTVFSQNSPKACYIFCPSSSNNSTHGWSTDACRFSSQYLTWHFIKASCVCDWILRRKAVYESGGKTPLIRDSTPASDLEGLTIKSWPGNCLPSLRSFVISIRPCKQISGEYFKSGHNSVLPHSLWHIVTNHPISRCYIIWATG